MPTAMERKAKARLARALKASKAVRARLARELKAPKVVREETTQGLEELTVSVSKFRGSMSEYINAVHYLHQRLILIKNGKPAVAIVPHQDLELLRRIEDAIDLEAAREALKETGEVPWEEVKAKLGL